VYIEGFIIASIAVVNMNAAIVVLIPITDMEAHNHAVISIADIEGRIMVLIPVADIEAQIIILTSVAGIGDSTGGRFSECREWNRGGPSGACEIGDRSLELVWDDKMFLTGDDLKGSESWICASRLDCILVGP